MKYFLSSLFLIVTSTSLVYTQQEYDYEEVLGLSIWFYEAQRCGILPNTNRVDWRGDSFVDDGSDVGLDLEGGYFDAGDHVKFGFPLAGTITILAWGVLDYRDGYLAAGEYENGLDMLKWGLDYMIKTHPEPNVIWVNVGNGTVDHSFWGRPEEWPEHLPRPSVGPINITNPGSDLAGEYAAAFASSSLVFQNVNATYSKVLLRHAVECFDFAYNYRGRYSENVYRSPEYGSGAYQDELLWAAAWLYRATRNPVYLAYAKILWNEFYLGYTPQGFGWDDKLAGAQILLARLAGTSEPEYLTAAENFCSWVRNDAPKTPLGLIFLGEWGSLRSIATVVFACLQVAELNIDSEANRAMAKAQIGYALGDTGRSFVVGFGKDPPSRPHHRASSCPSLPLPCDAHEASNSPDPNPQTLYGALVGGPGLDDSYEDVRGDYVKNEVALDYNAGFQSAIAGLISLKNRGLL